MSEQPKPFKIDVHFTDAELGVFAAQMEHVSTERQQRFQETMNNNHPKEFYKGLVAGYAASYALLQQIPAAAAVEEIRLLTAFLAAKVRKMKSIDLPGNH